MQQAMQRLSACDRALLKRYFVDLASQDELADAHGVTKQQISGRIASAVDRLLAHLRAE